MKQCSKCGEIKLFTEFHTLKHSKNGFYPFCKLCRKEESRKWRIENAELIKEKKKQYYIDNKSKICEKSKLWRSENKEEYAKQMKAYYEKHSDKLKQRTIDWSNQNKKRKSESDKKYRLENAEKIRALIKEYKTKKIQRKPTWLSDNDAESIRLFYEAASAFKLYTGNEYHVDHIVPLQGKTVSGLHVPWNLQVLKSTDNIKKGNRFWPDMW